MRGGDHEREFDEPEPSLHLHSWQPKRLAALGDEPEPEASISGLLYPSSLGLLYGEPEAVKTWLGLVLALEQIRAGHHVVWIDLEMSARSIHGRLLDLGVTDEELERFHYLQPSEPLKDQHVRADVAALVSAYGPSLVVVDALAGVLALHALDGNSGADVETLYGAVLAPFRANGAAVVVVDHVTKDRETRGRWPIGSQRKLGAVDVGISIEMVKPFSRGRTGLARLHVRKDRLGALPRPYAGELELVSDPDTGRIIWTIKPSEHTDEGGSTWKPTVLMERVFQHLKERGEPLSRTAIAREVGGSKEYVLQAVDELVSEGTLEESDGPRGARLYSLTNPSDPSATRSETGARSHPSDPSTPPYRGDGSAETGELDFFGETDDDIPF